MGKEEVIGGGYAAVLIALGVVMGMAADSIWVGLLVFVGVVALHVAFNRAHESRGESALWIAWIALALISWAAQLAEYAGRWLWSIPWVLAVILLIATGAVTIGRAQLVSMGLFTMAGISALMAVVGPLELHELDQGATQEVLRGWLWAYVVVLGLVALGAAVYQAQDYEPGFYVALAMIGIGLLVAATWFGRDASAWWFAPVWIVAAGLVAYGAWEIRDLKPGSGWTMLVVSIACFGFAMATPFVLADDEGVNAGIAEVAASTTTAVPTTTPPPSPADLDVVDAQGSANGSGNSWFSTVPLAVWEMVRSGWGILYLAIAFALGSIWSRRWGGVTALVALMGVVGWTAATADIGHGRAAELLSGSPASLAGRFISNSGQWFGSPGWGVLLLGAVFALAVLPSVKRTVTAQLEAGAVSGVSGLFGMSGGSRGRPELEGWTAVLAVAHMAILGGLVVSVWMGLQRIPAAADTASFLGVPDITVASFRPVWHLSYFVVGLALGAVTVANQKLYRRVGLRGNEQAGETFGGLVGPILLALVAPAGVLLFLLSHVLLAGSATVLLGRRVGADIQERRREERRRRLARARAAERRRGLRERQEQEQRAERERRKPETRKGKPHAGDECGCDDCWMDRVDEEQRGREQKRSGTEVPETRPKKKPDVDPQAPPSDETVFASDPIGETQFDGGATDLASDPEVLYQSRRPLVDLLPVDSAAHLLLHEDGALSRWHRDRIEAIPGALLKKPLGLAPGRDDEIIAADGANRLLKVSVSDGAGPRISENRVDLTIGCFAVNPYGTIVAYAPLRRPDVFAVLLASGDQQTLAEDVGGVTALAFSSSGHHLAMGFRDARVRLFDMSTRRVVLELEPPTGVLSRVVSLAQCPERGWVAACENGRLVLWDDAGIVTTCLEEGHRLSSLAVCGVSGRVAVGSTDGHVLIHSADLDRLELHDHGSTDEVVRVAFEADQRSLVSAARDGTVRRVTL